MNYTLLEKTIYPYSSFWVTASIKHLRHKQHQIKIRIHSNKTEDIEMRYFHYRLCKRKEKNVKLSVINSKFTKCQQCFQYKNIGLNNFNYLNFENIQFISLDQSHDNDKHMIEISSVFSKIQFKNIFIRNSKISGIRINLEYGINNSWTSSIAFKQCHFENINFPLINVSSENENLANFSLFQTIFKNSSGKETFIKIVNFNNLIQDNLFINNIANSSIIDSFSDRKNIFICQRNAFFTNSLTKNDREKGILSFSAYKIQINDNIFNDNENFFQLYCYRNRLPLIPNNCSGNWWGSRNYSKRIYDGHKNPLYTILNVNTVLKFYPNIDISRRCGKTGWREVENSCYFFHYGPLTYNESLTWCLKTFSILINQDQLRASSQLKSYITHKDNNISNDVWLLGDDNENVSSVADNRIKPFICKQSISFCKENCNNNGLCINLKCICKSGWNGETCSQFNCQGVRSCSKNGKCIGPNNCLCKPGYYGKTCSSSYCPRYFSCFHCTRKKGCGWCDERKVCIPGSASKPDTSCKDWFFDNCLSVENHGCSKEITSINCLDNSRINYYHQEMCQDVEKCLKKSKTGCKSWDELNCPKRFIQSDLTSKTRLENVVLKRNIIFLDNEFYICKTTENIYGTGNLLIVFKQSDKIVEKKSILVSRNNRIHHEILDLIKIESNYTLAIGKDLNLFLEIYDYGNFKVKGKFYSKIKKNSMNKVEYEKFIQQNNGIFLLNSQKFQASGNIYSYHGNFVNSYFIITNQVNKLVRGNIVYSNDKRFILEKVWGKINSNYKGEGFIISTILNDLHGSTGTFDFNSTVLLQDFNIHCSGNTVDKNLLYINDKNMYKSLEKDDLVTFQTLNSPLLGVVIKAKNQEVNGWSILEVIDLKDLSDTFEFQSINYNEIKEIRKDNYSPETVIGDRLTLNLPLPNSIELSVSKFKIVQDFNENFNKQHFFFRIH